MGNFASKTLAYVKAHKVATGVVIIVVVLVGYYGYKKASGTTAVPQYVLGTVERGTLISSVTGTGQVATQDKVDLKPQGSSQSAETITTVNVKQGDIVKAGQLVAVIDNKSALVTLRQAQASVESAQANYNKVVNGATSVQINTNQVALDNAKQDLNEKIREAYTSIDNIMRTSIDKLFINANSYSPQFNPTYFDSSSNTTISLSLYDNNQALNLGFERADINNLLKSWQATLDAGTSTDQMALATTAINNATKVRKFLDDISNALNTLSLEQTKYGSAIDGYKSDVASSRSTTDSAISSITSAEQSILTNQASLDQTRAPARPEDVQTAKAQLDNANASLFSAQTTYNNSFIRAPFDGEIAQVNVVPGDQADTSTVIATLVTQQRIAQISLNEVDAAKIKLGDQVNLTFDAIPDLTLTGKVAQIDTIGTVSQGVVSYNVKIAFDTQDERIKPGMSVSAEIITDSKPDVLIVPTSAIKTSGNNSYIQTLDLPQNTTGTITTAATPRSIPVTLGDSNDTETEIVSGVTEGEQIITRTISGSNATTRSTTPTLFGGGARTGGGGGGAGNAARVLR